MPNIVRVPSLRLTELDGSPDIQGVERIYLTNGYLSDLGGGNALLSLSGSAGGSSLTVRDVDGSPNVSNVSQIYLTNGFLSDLGGGSVLISLSGSSGAPSDADYWVETANGSLSAEVVVGTTGITTAAYGSRQAAAKAGRLFLPSDSFYLDRDTGSAWADWGPLFAMTQPVDGDFSWVNQGSATVSTTNGGIYLSSPGSASVNLRCRVKAKTAPYTITAYCAISFDDVASSPLAGLCFRDSAGGGIVNVGLCWISNIISWHIGKYTNATTWSGANYVYQAHPLAATPGPGIWIRIADNNTNRICSYSLDGQNYRVLHTVGRTDFITANQVGFFVEAGSSASQNPSLTLMSWKET